MKIIFFNRVFLFLILYSLSASAQTFLPNLQMTTSNGTSTVLWPLTAYDCILQTTTELSPLAMWTNLAAGDQIVASDTLPMLGGGASCTTNIIAGKIAFSLPAINGQQFFRLSTPSSVPACCFAIYYNGLMEFTTCSTMAINGRVHANGPIYAGSSSPLTFNAPVTTTFTLSGPANGGSSSWPTNIWNVNFNGNPGYITNCIGLHISLLNPTNYHFLIDVPPASEAALSSTGQLRLFNEAGMILLVTNDITGSGNPTVKLILQNSVNGNVPGADPLPAILIYTNAAPALLSSNLSFLSLTNNFYDQREMKTNVVTQIDIGRLAAWFTTSSIVQSKFPSGAGIYPTLFYVADNRNASPTQLAVVRLSNGAQLPANGGYGFSVATPNPLYTWGNYNVKNNSGTATGTNNPYEVPAALMSDALTILSANWVDANSTLAYATYRNASDTTINAAIVTGTMPSTDATYYGYSGGVQNLPRLLEDWMVGDSGGQQNLYLNTSILRLWTSQMATNQFRQPGNFNLNNNSYYDPPKRWFFFDTNFLNPGKLPPGIPYLN